MKLTPLVVLFLAPLGVFNCKAELTKEDWGEYTNRRKGPPAPRDKGALFIVMLRQPLSGLRWVSPLPVFGVAPDFEAGGFEIFERALDAVTGQAANSSDPGHRKAVDMVVVIGGIPTDAHRPSIVASDECSEN